MTREAVAKTYKLYIGGAFPRSESGRTWAVTDRKGRFLANAAKASRKDARDAVRKARAAQSGWAASTAYLRGQIIYRIAEMLEGRRVQLEQELRDGEGLTAARAAKQVDETIDALVWYAGWTDKVAQVAGGANPVAGAFFNISVPEPTGVVAILAPEQPSLLGLVQTVVPALVTGNTVVVIASGSAPLPAMTFAEVLATSDVPAGVVNILTGDAAEIAPWLATHADVNGLDLTGAGDLDWAALEADAAGTLKRVQRPRASERTLDGILRWTETKTVWHPKGMR